MEGFGSSLSVVHVNKQVQYLVFVNENLHYQVFPETLAEQIRGQSFVFYRINHEKKQIVGFRNQQEHFEEIWTFNLAENEEILRTDTAFNHYLNTAPPKIGIYDDVKIIYKHIDYLNFALVTKRTTTNNRGVLNLYIINSNTGRVLYNSYQSFVELALPINLVYDENTVIVTYYNEMVLPSED